MCGILALIGADRPADAMCDEALELIRHRGPDDGGSWGEPEVWLGSRRLAIIDVSSSGHQPMRDDASGVVVTYNGEIYNYIELRAELETRGRRFRTKTDTEVLLHAYLEWGEECLRRLNGMWAFVIWDPRRRRAFFARDRFGVKPFYLAMVDGTLAVASEPKELLHLYPGLRTVDIETLYRFLALGRLADGKRSFYRGVGVLPPAHAGSFGPGDAAPEVHRYWALPEAPDGNREFASSVDEFTVLFEDAVRLRMRSDVPVGMTLSGGLDSTAVLAAAAGVGGAGGDLRAYTSVYRVPERGGSADEREWARLAAQRYPGVQLHEVQAGQDDWLGTLRRIVWHLDGPAHSHAVFPLWEIMRAARGQGVPVLLEGQGADELLGGYVQYATLMAYQTLRTLVTAPSAAQARRALAEVGALRRLTNPRNLTTALARQVAPELDDAVRRRIDSRSAMRPDFVVRANGAAIGRAGEAGEPSLQRTLARDFTRNLLPGLLQYGDAISMAHSVESRLPFLDYRLVEALFRMPAEHKVASGETKRVLRAHLRNVGQPGIAARIDKKGYPTPVDAWLAADNGALFRDVLLRPGAKLGAYCEPRQMARLIDRHVAGPLSAGHHLYRLLTAELWLEACDVAV